MLSKPVTYRSRSATAIFDLLNPIPYGFFVGTCIFDVIYASNADVMWAKGAAWLVTIGLFFAIVPRFLNLGHVWFASRGVVGSAEKVDFCLNLIGIVAAIFNAFLHSRDAYGIVPLNVILSVVTVVALGAGQLVLAFNKVDSKGNARE